MRRFVFVLLSVALVALSRPASALAVPGMRSMPGEPDRSARDPWIGRTIAPSIPTVKCPDPCETGISFQTMDNIDGVSPADPTGAAGDNHVVAAINTHMGVYSRAGGVEVSPIGLKGLFPDTKAQVFDPKVVYDQYNQHYVLVFLGERLRQEKSYLFVVTIPDATAADPATWCERRFNADRSRDGVKQLADYPGLGYDQTRIYVTANMYGFPKGYYGAQIMAFDKASLYDCLQDPTPVAFYGKKTLDPRGKKVGTIQPATSVGTTSAEYMLSFNIKCTAVTCGGKKLVLWSVVDASGKLKLSKVGVPVGLAELPPLGTQKGGSSELNTLWDPGDLRLTNAFYDSVLNKVYAAHSVAYDVDATDGYQEATVRWYEIQPGSPLDLSTLTRSGYIGMTGLDEGWPAVATDDLGNLFVTLSAAGVPADKYLSPWAATVAPGASDPVAPVQLTLGGDARYEVFSGWERWGDFNAINRDPTDGTMMWSFNQSARATSGAITDDFVEVVHQLTNVP